MSQSLKVLKDLQLTNNTNLALIHYSPSDAQPFYFVGIVQHHPANGIEVITHVERCYDNDDGTMIYNKRALFNGQNAQTIMRKAMAIKESIAL